MARRENWCVTDFKKEKPKQKPRTNERIKIWASLKMRGVISSDKPSREDKMIKDWKVSLISTI